jgi:hypothetical protein
MIGQHTTTWVTPTWVNTFVLFFAHLKLGKIWWSNSNGKFHLYV